MNQASTVHSIDHAIVISHYRSQPIIPIAFGENAKEFMQKSLRDTSHIRLYN